MKIIIYGKGSFSKLLYYYLTHDSDYEVKAFCVDQNYLDADSFCNLPLVAVENIENLYPPSDFKVIVAVGYSNMRARKIMFDKIKNIGYTCVNYISSNALVDDSVKLGENNIILQDTVIEPFVKIGDNNIFWTSVNISHDVEIESHSFIATQSLVGGYSKIKNNCFLGFNTTVLHNITLEEETLVGAKSLVLSDTKKFTKYIGNPAKEVSSHLEEGIHIK